MGDISIKVMVGSREFKLQCGADKTIRDVLQFIIDNDKEKKGCVSCLVEACVAIGSLGIIEAIEDKWLAPTGCGGIYVCKI